MCQNNFIQCKKTVTVTIMNPNKTFVSNKNEEIYVKDEGRYLEIFGIDIKGK